MQEQLNSADENEPEDAKGPRQGDGVRTCARWEADSYDVEPEACNRDDRKGIYQDDPWRKSVRFDRTAPAELDQEDEGKNRTGGCAGHPPDDRVGNMKEVKKCGYYSESGDEKTAFNVEAHEAEMPIGEFTS
jgi:hypothetical protein